MTLWTIPEPYFIGKGQQPLKPFDYSSYVMPSQVDQYPQLCMDVETPFDAEQKEGCAGER